MTRVSKQGRRRNVSFRKRRPDNAVKTGPKKDNLDFGYKEKYNAVTEDTNDNVFIARIK